MSKIPHLFAWGDDGLPAEFKVYLKLIGGDDGASLSDFMHNGVVQLSAKYRAILQKEKDAWEKSKSKSPKLSHEIRSIVYLLHAYCSHCRAPAPAELLLLTFEALDLKEGHPAIDSNRFLAKFQQNSTAGLADIASTGGVIPNGIKKLSAFIRASALDGEADARGETLTVARVARVAGVSRPLIRAWRGMEEYKSRRRVAFAAWSANLAASPRAGANEWKGLQR